MFLHGGEHVFDDFLASFGKGEPSGFAVPNLLALGVNNWRLGSLAFG